jgi:hypothetical protein
MTLDLSPFPAAVAAALRGQLPAVAERTVAEIVVEVPGYADAFSGEMGQKIQNAVQLALGGFLELATSTGADPGTPIGPAMDGAYALGRGEARSGRSMDALLAAYRVGARVAWRELSATAVTAGLSPGGLARFAELVFAYIDRLSGASVAGHADELATTGRVRQRYLERLAQRLLAGAEASELLAAAEHAEWAPPRSVTAVLLPEPQARRALVLLDPRTLQLTEDLPDLPAPADLTALLVPDADGSGRAALLRSLEGGTAVVGPARPWTAARASYLRAVRAVLLGLGGGRPGPLDTDACLADLVVGADTDALADLRARALAPMDRLAAGAREKLTETLRSWLLHHGRRDRVAAELFVHPQTVRYRMQQLRELYGSRLEDPRTVLELTIALGAGG